MNNRMIWTLVILALLGLTYLLFWDRLSAHFFHRDTFGKSMVFKETPQGKLSIDFNFPLDWQTSDNRPVAIFFFGGGWVEGRPAQFKWQAEYLAQQGIVSARADYRTATRHGTDPRSAVEDARDAIIWIRSHAASLGIDPRRVVAIGGSAGGHLAANAASARQQTSDATGYHSAPDLLILFNPVLDLTNATPALEFSGTELDLIDAIGPEQALSISPNKHLHSDMPPSLLIFGSADPLLVQGLEYLEQYQALGLDAQLLIAPQQVHGFFNREPWRLGSMQRIADWLHSQGYVPDIDRNPPDRRALFDRHD